MREAIISGRLQPGGVLRQEELARRFSASRMPVREALRTLSAEGLVHLQPNRGAIVAPLDPAELQETVEMRDAAEVLACGAPFRISPTRRSTRRRPCMRKSRRRLLRAFGALNKAFPSRALRPLRAPKTACAYLGSARHLRTLSEGRPRRARLCVALRIRARSHSGCVLQTRPRQATDLISKHILGAGTALATFLSSPGDRGST